MPSFQSFKNRSKHSTLNKSISLSFPESIKRREPKEENHSEKETPTKSIAC